MPTFTKTTQAESYVFGINAILNNLLDNLPEFYEKESGSYNYQLFEGIAVSLSNYTNFETQVLSRIFVSTATSDDLDKIGEFFNLTRFPGENDTAFRARIKSFLPGFIGGGIEQSIITNLHNYFDWTVLVEDYATPVPKFKLKINAIPAVTDIFTGAVTIAEFETYVGTIKAAGVGWDYGFYLFGEESVSIQEIISFTFLLLFEAYYDDIAAEYDDACMYG